MKLILKDCGKHYGHSAGPCSKCPIIAKDEAQRGKGLQYNGTSWHALFEPSEAMLEQDRIASLIRNGLYRG